MMRMIQVAVLAAAVMVLGCDGLQAKVKRENIEGATIHFVPDVDNGNVSEWWYEFSTDGSEVLGCNANRVFTASSWDIDEDAGRVTVYFGGDYEDYVMSLEDGSDYESGRFNYENSIGTEPMEGDWDRTFSKPCSNR